MPVPLRRSADRSHDAFGEHLRQRPAEAPQQRQRQAIHPHVVIFPECARRPQRPCIALPALPFHREVAIAIDDVGLAEQRALPFGGLLQEGPPGDGPVMRTVEPAVVPRPPNRLVEFRYQPVSHGNAGQQAEIALGDRKSEVDLPRVAPVRNHRTAPQDQPIRTASWMDGPENFVMRRWLKEAGLEVCTQIARPWRLVRQSEIDSAVQHGSSWGALPRDTTSTPGRAY